MPPVAEKHVFWTVILSLWRGLRLICLAIAGWAVLLKAWDAIDPPEPLRVSEETTLITEPIGPDGRPEFGKALLRQMKPATSPSANGAIPFWRAIGTSLFEEGHADLLFKEIGGEPPINQGVLTRFPTVDRLFDSKVASEPAVVPDGKAETFSLRKKALLRIAAQRPWPADLPEMLSSWVDNNRNPLDLLVQASLRSEFYSPSPSLLEERPPELIATLLPAEQAISVAVPSLLARAMRRLSEHDKRGSLNDIESAQRLAMCGCTSDFLIGCLVECSNRNLCSRALLAWVDHAGPREIETVIEDLKELPEPVGVNVSLRTGETQCLIEAALICSLPERRRPGQQSVNYSNRFEVNEVLMRVRKWLTRLEQLARINERAERLAEAERIDHALEELAASYGGSGFSIFLQAAVSRHARSRFKADEILLLMCPAVTAACVAEDTCCAQQRMTLIATSLKLFRLQNGEYPDSLDALPADQLTETPFDPFTNKPFLYERRGDGFALWSVGRNGVDDGGNDRAGEFINGDYAPIDWTGERPMRDGPDDVVVRLPVPPLELPDVAAGR